MYNRENNTTGRQTMKRSELLKQYKIVATRRPKKGETIIAVKWVGGDCSVVKVTGDNNRVVADILEKVDNRD